MRCGSTAPRPTKEAVRRFHLAGVGLKRGNAKVEAGDVPGEAGLPDGEAVGLGVGVGVGVGKGGMIFSQ
jgi:hypothetical protein